MTFRLIWCAILSLNAAQSSEPDSFEINKVDISPFYDTIILSDVADIVNEFENTMKTPLENIVKSESESEENVDDLLSEYQNYLDKANKERVEYHEKAKRKNKIPATRHDRFIKTKPIFSSRYNNYVYPTGYFAPSKYPSLSLSNPLDILIPTNSNPKYIFKTDVVNIPKYTTPKDNHEEFSTIDKRILELTPVLSRQKYEPLKSSCVCKNPQLPCDCKCKHCIALDSTQQGSDLRVNIPQLPQNHEYTEDRQREGDNTLNVGIKIEIQLPNIQDINAKIFKNRSREDNGISKELSFSLPFPYFHFPIPMDAFGYKRISKVSAQEPGHKIAVHKKKKSRISNGIKKHRKKVVALHNLNIQQKSTIKIKPNLKENSNLTDDVKEISTTNLNQTLNNNSAIITKVETNVNMSADKHVVNKTIEPIVGNETQTEDSIFVVVNITNSGENATEDMHKNENSVETEYQKLDLDVPIAKLSDLRKKREIAKKTVTNSSNSANNDVHLSLQVNLIKNNDSKKSDKVILADPELTYWPSTINNQSNLTSRNITTIILQRENKKAKLNMTKDAIRNNHTQALEKAIFGDVNWDDVDTVAPIFMSFVGKYLKGVLTFCSENVCNSMNCANKTCVHRACAPNERWNQRGHCSGIKYSDSVASLESIMDLPSNVAFKIVDILQDKMLGKLFGKVTLCISSKCISFVATKKKFLKSKCLVKELNSGHCPNMKDFKIM